MPQVLTKAWTAALLNAVGDILAQTAVERNERLDLKRLGIFSFLVRWLKDRQRRAPARCEGAERRGALRLSAGRPTCCMPHSVLQGVGACVAPVTACWGAAASASCLHARG
jgi:hypothetical protein